MQKYIGIWKLHPSFRATTLILFHYLRYPTIFRFRCTRISFRKQQQLLGGRFFRGELKWDPVAEEGSVPRKTCRPWYTSYTYCTPAILLRQSKLCYPTKTNSISHVHQHDQFDFLFFILLQTLCRNYINYLLYVK